MRAMRRVGFSSMERPGAGSESSRLQAPNLKEAPGFKSQSGASLRGFARLGALALALLVVGCGGGEKMESEADVEAIAPVEFDSGAGLKLAEETIQAMGLETGPVGVGRFRDTFHSVARSMGELEDGGLCLRAVVPEGKAPVADAEMTVARENGDGAWPGRLLEVNRSLVAASGDVELLVRVESGADIGIAAGGGATLHYPLSGERESASVPESALIRAALGDFVYVVTGAGYQRRRVLVGQLTGGRAELRSGVKPGEVVVNRGSDEIWILELALVGGMTHLENMKGER
jgi:hypothetical protein